MNEALSQLNFEGLNKVEVALLRLREFEPPEGYFLAFSGGKDSVVLYDLAVKSGVRFDAHYNNTGIDPPELVKFIRQHYPQVKWERPLVTIWKLIEQHSLPRRQARFCCEYLKEHTGIGRVVLTGVRWEESAQRKRRTMVESSRCSNKRFVHPIIDWTGEEVWEYLSRGSLPYCSLYDIGASGPYKGDGEFKRLGCILCPMTTAKQTERDRLRWPKVADAWFRACQRYYARGTEGTKHWTSAEEMFEWWLTRKGSPKGDDCQMGMFV